MPDSTWLARLRESGNLAAVIDDLPETAPAEIHAALLGALYTDPGAAARLTALARELASLRPTLSAKAYAARCEGHLAFTQANHDAAAVHYRDAADLFRELREDAEVARSLSSGTQALIYLGRYDEAHRWADEAETLFVRLGDVLRLARLDSNVGNIYFRQDQPAQAIERYRRALDGFGQAGDAKDVAAVLSNMAVCYTSLGKFADSLRSYREAREHCLRHELHGLAAQADYNIAYLYYLRGDYAEARRLYGESRTRCTAVKDAYHLALCDLDEAEMLLELNLTSEGLLLARKAVSQFKRLGLRYEQAKALVNIAVGASQRGDRALADLKLRAAKRLFVAENNRVWTAMTDLLRAVLALHDGRHRAAEHLSAAAWEILRQTVLPARAAYCRLVLARLWLRSGHADRARAVAREALEQAGEDPSPSLRFHASLLEGEVHEQQGRMAEARTAYESARREVEDLRGRLDTEDLRISVLKDKLAVYDALVPMALDRGGPADTIEALLLIQEAKSRTLVDRLARLYPDHAQEASESSRIDRLRGDLNWCYRQIEQAAVSDSLVRVHDLRLRSKEIEDELLHLASPRGGSAVCTLSGPENLDALRSTIPPGTALIEYFEARGVLNALVLTPDSLQVRRLRSSSAVWQSLKLLQFQIGKFRVSPGAGSGPPEASTNHHLGELYDLLLRPLLDDLRGCEHLVIAPHRNLHGLAFGALFDGFAYLIDRFTISMTPSSQVFATCRRRPRVERQGSVVLGLADRRAPRIIEETLAVAAELSDARLFLGPDASVKSLKENAGLLRVLHLATHGVFRRDNPMFSSLQLADGHLSLFDLRHMTLDVDLLTLSACDSGRHVTAGGDELVGLMRGFLSAGVRTLLLSLWEIDDESTVDFMKSFYRGWGQGLKATAALRHAMQELRAHRPHPYYWAPFALSGDSDV